MSFSEFGMLLILQSRSLVNIVVVVVLTERGCEMEVFRTGIGGNNLCFISISH